MPRKLVVVLIRFVCYRGDMKFIYAIYAMGLMACGPDLLEPGTYNVRIQYTRDDWPQSRAGEISHAKWHIQDMPWRLRVEGGHTTFKGAQEQGHLVFDRTDDFSSFRVDIDPSEDGHSFFAHGVITLTLCNNEHCQTLYTNADIRSD